MANAHGTRLGGVGARAFGIWIRLARYLIGDLGGDEGAKVARWIRGDSHRAMLVASIRRTWAQSEPVDAYDVKAALDSVMGQLDHGTLGAVPPGIPSVVTHVQPHAVSQQTERMGGFRAASRYSARYGAAAALLVVVVLGAWLVQSDRIGIPARAHTYQTAPGQRSTIHLAEGATITLGPATSVTMTTRGATVTGEALFSVTPHPTRPFVVQTTNSIVRVLGTRFMVRQYPGEVTSRIVVEDGRVSVGSRTRSAGGASPSVLSARMLAQVSDSGFVVSSGIATREYTSWSQGLLVFNRVALRDVIAELARAYGVEIQIADPLMAERQMRLDVSVEHDPLNQVLDVISDVMRAHYVRHDRTYVLMPGRARQDHSKVVPQRFSNPQLEQSYGR